MLDQIQSIVDGIYAGRLKLAQFQAEGLAAAEKYDRHVAALRRRIELVEARRNEDPGVIRATECADDLSAAIAQEEQRAEALARAAWDSGALVNKTTVLEHGAIHVRETTSRTIVEPVAFLDQVRAAGLYARLVRGVKVSVDVAGFNRWVDLMEPSSVAVEKATAVQVRIEGETR